jgi:hypothetical protein
LKIALVGFHTRAQNGVEDLVRKSRVGGKPSLFGPSGGSHVVRRISVLAVSCETRLIAYAKQQKPSEWIKAQPAFVGAQGKSVFDPDFDIDDGGLPHEKELLPHR